MTTLAEQELRHLRTKVVFTTLGFAPLATKADWQNLKELADMGLALASRSATAAPAAAPAAQGQAFSLDSDAPLVGGVCDTTPGCESCQ